MKTTRLNKTVSLCTMAAMSIAFVACSQSDETIPVENDGSVALEVTSGIQTRASETAWEANDAIGIYMLDGVASEKANVSYKTADVSGTFTPSSESIYFPANGDARDFIAYYPYNAAVSADFLYPVDVATQTSQAAIDFMTAAKVTGKSKTDKAVAFTFTHKLVKLEVVVKGDGTSLADAELAGTTMTITNQLTAGTYDVVAGSAVTVTSTVGVPINLLVNGLTAQAIVLPCADTKGVDFTFTVPSVNTFTWNIKDEASQSQVFEAGKKYKYTITLGRIGVTSVTSTIEPWTAGNGTDGETGSAE